MNILARTFLNAGNSLSHFLSSGHGLFRKLAHFIGNHSKTTSGITCTSSFNGSVQSKQIGLISNISNHTHDLPDTFRLLTKDIHIFLDCDGLSVNSFDTLNSVSDNFRAFLGLLASLMRYICSLLGITCNFQNSCIHFFHGGGGFAHTTGLLICTTAGLLNLR